MVQVLSPSRRSGKKDPGVSSQNGNIANVSWLFANLLDPEMLAGPTKFHSEKDGKHT